MEEAFRCCRHSRGIINARYATGNKKQEDGGRAFASGSGSELKATSDCEMHQELETCLALVDWWGRCSGHEVVLQYSWGRLMTTEDPCMQIPMQKSHHELN